MSYRIEYDQHNGKYEVRKEKISNFTLYAFLTGVGIFTSVILLWPEAGAALRSMLIPGDDTVTVQAFHNMTDDMRSGASLADAVYTFCHYVIHGS